MAGVHGHAAQIFAENEASNTVFTAATAIADIMSISGPDQTRDSVDISSMDSASKFREFIPAMADTGEVTFELNYDGTTIASLLNVLSTATAHNWGINFGDETNTSVTAITGMTSTSNSTIQNTGFITALGHAIPFDDKITQSVTVKFTGTPNWSAIGESKSA